VNLCAPNLVDLVNLCAPVAALWGLQSGIDGHHLEMSVNAFVASSANATAPNQFRPI
jgi:hypothetical protein